MPLVLNFDISEIADHEAFSFGLIELTLQHIRCCCFVTSGLMRLILRYRVRGHKTAYLMVYVILLGPALSCTWTQDPALS
ncbi:hypothetical protein PASE110613_17990 [Paenibacillus sediminis]